MKRLLLTLALLPLLAFAGPSDIVTSQRNTTDTGSIPRTVAKPPGSADGVMGFNGATQLPIHWTLGPGLIVTGGALDTVPGGAPAWTSITGKPTTLAGYGITDGVTSAALTAGLATRYPVPTGTTAQYVRGDGSLATLPVARRIETYTGTTNASGQITVTYGVAYPAVPVVQPPAPPLANQVWTTVASTTTGFTLQLNQRNTVTLLSVEVLLGATVPVVGSAATVLVVAQ